MIQEFEIQVLVIQESKMQDPTIPMVEESNEGSRIQEHSKVQEFKWILKVHETTNQREVYEYCDQDVTKILVLWKISFDDDANHNNTLWVILKGRGMLGISYLL